MSDRKAKTKSRFVLLKRAAFLLAGLFVAAEFAPAAAFVSRLSQTPSPRPPQVILTTEKDLELARARRKRRRSSRRRRRGRFNRREDSFRGRGSRFLPDRGHRTRASSSARIRGR